MHAWIVASFLWTIAAPVGGGSTLLGTAHFVGGGGTSSASAYAVRRVGLELGYLGGVAGGTCVFPRVGCESVALDQVVPGAVFEWTPLNSLYFSSLAQGLVNGSDDRLWKLVRLFGDSGTSLFGGGQGGSESVTLSATPDFAGMQIDAVKARVNSFTLTPDGVGLHYSADIEWEIYGTPAAYPAPRIELIRPRAGDTLMVGSPTSITWNATDEAGVSAIDLSLSRDNGLTFEAIATGLPDTGHYDWPVTGPSHGAPRFDSYLLARAHGVAGNASADLGGAFAISDVSTPAQISGFRAEPMSDGIRVSWRVAPEPELGDFTVERAARGLGPWTVLTSPIEWSDDAATALDRDVNPGRTYFYRLRVSRAGEILEILGPLEATALGGAPAGLILIAPNPALGETRIAYAIASAALVRLVVSDVQGREVAVLADGFREAGRHEALWSPIAGGRVAPGVYFVTLRAGDRSWRRRIAIAR